MNSSTTNATKPDSMNAESAQPTTANTMQTSMPSTQAKKISMLCSNHLDSHQVFNAHDVKESQTRALRSYLNRYNHSRWLQLQRGHPELGSLSAASNSEVGFAVCYCGNRLAQPMGRCWRATCGKPQFCPRCNYINRVRPLQREYADCFENAPFWYFFTLSWKGDPCRAGLRYKRGHNSDSPSRTFLPFARSGKNPILSTYSFWDTGPIVTLEDTLFRVSKGLEQFFSGHVTALEWSASFWPVRGSTGKVHACKHIALPHMHGFGNSSKPITFHRAKEILKELTLAARQECLGGSSSSSAELLSYPDIEISPIDSQQDLSRVIGYCRKPLDLVTMYEDGWHRKIPLPFLNHEFHQIVWDIYCPVRSLRKHGNLFSGKKDMYIATQQLRKLSNKEVNVLIQLSIDGELSDKDRKRLEKHRAACDQEMENRAKEKKHRDQRLDSGLYGLSHC